MLYIKNLKEGLEVFKTLGSDVRMRIVELLCERGEMNMNEIATALDLTNGALTSHIRRLEECGIIQTVTECTGHGNQKICSIKTDQILLTADSEAEAKEVGVYDTEVRVSHYSDCSVARPCGLCSGFSQIGPENDPRMFHNPERLQARMLWFADGYVEYRIPNVLTENQKMSQITFYFEISQDHIDYTEESLADVAFYLNGYRMGTWLTPPEFRLERGIYTPTWWNGQEKQSGVQKMIVVNSLGTYLEGVKCSDIGLRDLGLQSGEDLRFRLAVENRGNHRGGIVLYGAGFGNYNQDIRVRIHYTMEK